MGAFLKAGPRRGVPRALLAATLILGGCGGDDGAGAGGPPADQGPPGPEGPPGAQDAPSISAVSPPWMWLSRSQSIAITGYDTAWTGGATVDFGAGITVSDVVVASPTSIVATVTVAETAPLGARDVVVTADDGELTHAGGFEVRAGMEIVHVIGDGTQGSFNVFALSLDDLEHDLSGGTYTQPPTTGFVHTIDGAVQGVLPQIGITDQVFYEPGWAQVEVLLDVTGPEEGPFNLVTTSFGGSIVTSTGLVSAVPRTPDELTLGDPLVVAYGDVPLATHVFEYRNTSGEHQLVDLGIGTGGEPMLFFHARGSGRASDGFFAPSVALSAGVRDGESVYMMALAPESDTDFDFEALVDNARTAAFYASQETVDESCEDAQHSGIDLSDQEGLVIDNGVFDTITPVYEGSPAETDWYRFTVSTAANVVCLSQSNHDTSQVSIYSAADCMVPAGSGLPPGEYYLRVAANRLFTSRGPTRYAVVCSVAYP